MPDVAERLAADLAAAEAELGETGRVLVRPSGTEPVVRVMVEATDAAVAEQWTTVLVEAVAALSAPPSASPTTADGTGSDLP